MRTATAFAAVLLLAACAPTAATLAPTASPTVAPTARPPDRRQTAPPTLPSFTLPAVSDVPPDVLRQIFEQVESFSGVPPSEFELERAQAVTWSDGSLGCPQPGQMYTQALVEGYWVVVRAGGETYDFRGSGTDFRLCPPGLGRPPVDT